MRKYALVFDLGTGSLKASLYNEDGISLNSVIEDYPTYHRSNNIHEQDPDDWWFHLVSCTKRLIKDFDYADDIVGIAISGHSLGIVPLDKEGHLLSHRVPIWSDSRADIEADDFFKKVNNEEWFYQTGNGFPPALYPLFKIIWLKKNDNKLYEKAYKFIGTKDYLNYRLCGIVATDRSYASGSGLYSLEKHHYIKEYAEIADIDINKFPDIKKSDEAIGVISNKIAKELGLPSDVKIFAGGVDNACMTLGAGCYQEGETYLSLGSSAWAACSSSSPNLDYKKKVYAWEHVVEGMYVPSCGIFSAGTSLGWIKNVLLKMEGSYKDIDKMVKKAPLGSNGVIFNPVMAKGCGVDASHNMKGSWVNFDLNTTKEDMLRSVFEGVAYDLDLAFQALSNIKMVEPIRAVGGGSNSDIWVDIHANVLGIDIIVPNVKREAATLAAAGLVFKGVGIWKDYSVINRLTSDGKLYKKDLEKVKLYRQEKERFMLICRQAAEAYK